jgi:hypothetical protein
MRGNNPMKKLFTVLVVLVGLAGCAGQNTKQQYARTEHACAEIGLTPGTSRHTDCVANLNAGLATIHGN